MSEELKNNRELQKLCSERVKRGLHCCDCPLSNKNPCVNGYKSIKKADIKKLKKSLEEPPEKSRYIAPETKQKRGNAVVIVDEQGEVFELDSEADAYGWFGIQNDSNLKAALRSKGKKIYKGCRCFYKTDYEKINSDYCDTNK